jgi:hypothetical protein
MRRAGVPKVERDAFMAEATSGEYDHLLAHMSAGEQAMVLVLGADKKQASILRRYCQGLLDAPLLAAEVTRVTDDVIEFRNSAVLEIATNDARLVRGRSAIAVLGSEACHWRTDETAASSDEEVVAAAAPERLGEE